MPREWMGRADVDSGGTDAFSRIRDALEKATASGRLSARDARERLSDAVRLVSRLRRLEERVGRSGVADLSPYLESLLAVAKEPVVIGSCEFRRAAGF